MSIDVTECETTSAVEETCLPRVPGGWRRDAVDVGWTTIELAVPAAPDALLDLEEVREANRRDDSMPYWATLWPAAQRMARTLERAEWATGTDVLEIGTGLGLVGIAALKRGWRVRLTDVEPSSIATVMYNARLNGFPAADTFRLDWRRPPNGRFPVILGCDVLYETRHHAPILDLVNAMLAEEGCCWIGDPGRTPSMAFPQAARERRFAVTIRDADGQPRESPLHGDFQIFELTRQP